MSKIDLRLLERALIAGSNQPLVPADPLAPKPQGAPPPPRTREQPKRPPPPPPPRTNRALRPRRRT